MARNKGRTSGSRTTSPAGTRFLMTPERHQRQADLLKQSHEPKAQELDTHPAALALAIAAREPARGPQTPGVVLPIRPGISTSQTSSQPPSGQTPFLSQPPSSPASG